MNAKIVLTCSQCGGDMVLTDRGHMSCIYECTRCGHTRVIPKKLKRKNA